MRTALLLAALLLVGLAVLWAAGRVRSRRGFATPAERVTFETLHTANLAAPPLRLGLTVTSAGKSARHLRTLLGTPAVALTDTERSLVWEGPGDHHADQLLEAAAGPLESGRPVVVRPEEVLCRDPECPVRGAVVVPIGVDDRIVGTLAAITSTEPGPGLVQAALETARWVSTQLELAELDQSRARVVRAEVRALRAQISPHFVYNALTTIASFVRSDPARARELLLDFALFIRHNLARHGEYTTLAGEFRAVEAYLALARAVLGERLRVQVRIAPEVLPVAIPFLALQPLVENAVQHGVERAEAGGSVHVSGEADGEDCVIAVEDDGPGMAPERARAALAGRGGRSLGLVNVDRRLRAVFGAGYGLVIETAAGAGTRVVVRVPRFHPGVVAS